MRNKYIVPNYVTSFFLLLRFSMLLPTHSFDVSSPLRRALWTGLDTVLLIFSPRSCDGSLGDLIQLLVNGRRGSVDEAMAALDASFTLLVIDPSEFGQFATYAR